jgi:hypothetical protein
MKIFDDEGRWPKAGRLDEHDPDVFQIKARPARRTESWLGKSAQRDKWRFCLTAARMAA